MTFPLPSDNPVWKHFQTLCAIPRPSKHEQALRDTLQQWAQARALETQLDSAGNLIIRKPATPGMVDRKGVVLQGHLDMVCQKNAGTEHDFHRDPIRPVLQDGWLPSTPRLAPITASVCPWLWRYWSPRISRTVLWRPCLPSTRKRAWAARWDWIPMCCTASC